MMTVDEAIAAGLLAQAVKDCAALITEAEGEANHEPAEDRWERLVLELHGYDGHDSQQIWEGVALPPDFMPIALKAVRGAIVTELYRMGVQTDG